MELTDFKSQVLEPHIDRISSDVALSACQNMALNVSNFVGTPGVTPTSLDTYQDAHRLLTQGGTPTGVAARAMLIDANMDHRKALPLAVQLFNSVPEISKQYENGNMGIFGGAMWSMEQSLYQFTTGACAGTPVVNGALILEPGTPAYNQVSIRGLTANLVNAFVQGDKIAFAGSYMVNPTNGRIYSQDLQYFTVAANASASAGGIATAWSSLKESSTEPRTRT